MLFHGAFLISTRFLAPTDGRLFTLIHGEIATHSNFLVDWLDTFGHYEFNSTPAFSILHFEKKKSEEIPLIYWTNKHH